MASQIHPRRFNRAKDRCDHGDCRDGLHLVITPPAAACDGVHYTECASLPLITHPDARTLCGDLALGHYIGAPSHYGGMCQTCADAARSQP